MKIRDLKRQVGNTEVHGWPPSAWTSSYRPGDKFAVGEVGVLKGARRVDSRLLVTITYDGRQHLGSLEWDPPPALDKVLDLLKANVGLAIKAVGELDVP